MSTTPEKKSKWQPMFWNVSDRVGICDGCHNEISIGKVLFFFPKRKEDGFRGLVFCHNCIMKKIDSIIIAESL